VQTIKCNMCFELLECDMFHNSKNEKNGKKPTCKKCRRIQAIDYRVKYGDEIRAKDRERDLLRDNAVLDYRSNKTQAQWRSNYALKTGKIKRLPCEVCGNIKSQGHHDDYLKPYDVRFLCSVHHRIWHHDNGQGANT